MNKKKSSRNIENEISALDYRDIFNQVNDLIQQCDKKGTVINANDVWLKVLGYKKSDIGKVNIKDFVYSDHQKKCFAGLKKVFTGKRLDGIDITLVNKAGKKIYVKANASPYRDKTGKITATLTVFRDVSSEIKAEKKVLEEEEKIKNYLDVAGVMIISLDPSGKIVLINKKGCETLEDKQKNIVGKNWFDNFLPKEIKKDVFEVFKKLMNGEVKSVEYHENEILTKKRRKKIISFRNTIIKDKHGKISGILFSGEDVTAKKTFEQELLSYQEKIETIFNNSNDIIVYADTKGDIIDVNERVKNVLGYDRRDVLGKNFLKLGLIRASEALKIFGLFKEAVSKGVLQNTINLTLVKKSGEEVSIEASTNVIRKDKKIVGVVSLLRDVTEREGMEKSLLESKSRLRSLMEFLNDPICILDKNLKYLYANERYLLRIAKKLGEIIGQDYKNFHFADDAKEFEKKAAKVFKEGTAFVYGHKSERDGNYFLRTISPVKEGARQEVASITVISRDITSQKLAEEKLKDHTEELEKLNSLMLGRELKMIELKKKINELTSREDINKI